MKRLTIGLLLSLCVVGSAIAQHRHFGHRHHHGNYWNWVVPAVIGGAIVYGISQQTPPPPPPVVVQPQMPPPPYGYHYITALDPYCNCYKTVLVPN